MVLDIAPLPQLVEKLNRRSLRARAAEKVLVLGIIVVLAVVIVAFLTPDRDGRFLQFEERSDAIFGRDLEGAVLESRVAHDGSDKRGRLERSIAFFLPDDGLSPSTDLTYTFGLEDDADPLVPLVLLSAELTAQGWELVREDYESVYGYTGHHALDSSEQQAACASDSVQPSERIRMSASAEHGISVRVELLHCPK